MTTTNVRDGGRRQREGEGLEPGALGEAVANIDLGTKRWRRKVRIIQVIGRWPEGHKIGYRRLGERTGISPHLLMELLEELVEARIVVPVVVGRGCRATAWVVNPVLEHWGTDTRGRTIAGGVPWENHIRVVERWVFHDEHEQRAEPQLSRAYGPPSRRGPVQRREGGSEARRSTAQRREGNAYARDNDLPARGIRAALARQSATDPQEEVPPQGGGDDSAPPPRGAGGEDRSRIEGDQRRVAAAVRVAAGAPFFEGRPRAELHELVADVGAEQVLEWLVAAPTGLQLPRLVGWLVDQQYAPDDELLRRLAERAELQAQQARLDSVVASSVAAAEPGPPRLAEYQAPAVELGDEEAARAAMAEARATIKGSRNESADDTMTAATGGA